MLRRKSKIVFIVIGMIIIVIVAIVICAILFFRNKQKDTDVQMVTYYKTCSKVSADDLVSGSEIVMERSTGENVPEDLFVPDGNNNSRFKIEIPAGVILTKSMVYDKGSTTDDMRIHNFPFVELTDKITLGEYIDIRISFANGADYVLLSHKKVMDFSLYNEEESVENSLWIEVTEEEIMRMSSAVVDAGLSEGAKIYAIKYINSEQKGAMVNYPVSATIQALIESDPNIVEQAQKVAVDSLRKDIEDELNKEEDSTAKKDKGDKDKTTADDSDEELSMYDNSAYDKQDSEEIKFFD